MSTTILDKEEAVLSPSSKGKTSPTPSTEAPRSRRYFEVFGDVLNENSFLKNLVVGLLGLAVFLTILLTKLVLRPPIVIRVDDVDQPQVIKDLKSQSAVTAAEVRNFSRLFLKGFLAWDAYTYDDNFKEVFTMMSPDCRKRLDAYLKENNVVEKIQTEKQKTKLTISEITIVDDTPRVLVVKAKGIRDVSSYDNPNLNKQVIFEDTLTILKTDRGESTPWGMLVDNWSESLFKSQ